MISASRTLVAAALVGGIALAGALPAAAQNNSTTGKPPAAQAATSSKPETVEQRITSLKTALKITPDQESKWKDVATAMRDNAAAMDKLVQEKKPKMANMTAVEDLKTYEDFTKVHLDGMKNLRSSFETLYKAMPDDQKKNADKVFQSFGGSGGTQG
jgi:Spy/CpxP family protein refolding chaperone